MDTVHEASDLQCDIPSSESTEMYMISQSGLQGYLYNFYYKFSYHLPLKIPHPR
jgi:hypothetical protein